MGANRAVVMADTKLDAADLRFVLTCSGYVAIECESLDGPTQVDLFGPRGCVPPRPISDLVADTLAMVSAAPDGSDAADLKSMATDLKASLQQVEATLGKLGSNDA